MSFPATPSLSYKVTPPLTPHLRSSLGQLGQSTPDTLSFVVSSDYPLLLPSFASGGAKKIVSGEFHSCVLRLLDNRLACWGSNANVDLGWSRNAFCPPITAVPKNITRIVNGGRFACALTGIGEVYCWGRNGAWGALGVGDTVDRRAPVKVELAGAVTAIAAGQRHVCVQMLADSTMQCWGDNTYGQLGVNSTNSSFVPISVRGLGAAVVSFDLNSYHTCAVLSTMELFCWGDK